MRRARAAKGRSGRMAKPVAAKKQLIIDAAARVFRQQGYEGATLRDIAKEAGLLAGSLYYHIRSEGGDG